MIFIIYFKSAWVACLALVLQNSSLSSSISSLSLSVRDMFGAQIIHQHERYLGLPPVVGRGKKKAFHHILDQVGRKVAGWKGKLLTMAGREILIKAVA